MQALLIHWKELSSSSLERVLIRTFPKQNDDKSTEFELTGFASILSLINFSALVLCVLSKSVLTMDHFYLQFLLK